MFVQTFTQRYHKVRLLLHKPSPTQTAQTDSEGIEFTDRTDTILSVCVFVWSVSKHQSLWESRFFFMSVLITRLKTGSLASRCFHTLFSSPEGWKWLFFDKLTLWSFRSHLCRSSGLKKCSLKTAAALIYPPLVEKQPAESHRAVSSAHFYSIIIRYKKLVFHL